MIRSLWFAAVGISAVACVGGPDMASAQNSVAEPNAKASIDIARQTLAKQLNVTVDELQVVSAVPNTWPNSSLGCGKPGTQSLQVMTSGYEVIMKSANSEYRVHATDRYAVVCDDRVSWRSPRGSSVPLRELNAKIELARADLAKRLGANSREIRTQNSINMDWPDSSMDCPIEGEEIRKTPTRGFRIALNYRDRVYTYHTDLKRVRPCPAIEEK